MGVLWDKIWSDLWDNKGRALQVVLIMAVVIGMVSGVALSGARSLNVLDRRREIGVLRAIGEGVILGWLSWLVALPLSIAAGKLMAQGLGAAVDLELVYRYTPTGALG